jgi:hypothetical protein
VALRTRPIDGRAYRVLSAAAPTPAAELALLDIAVALAPRDVAGHLLLARNALEGGRFDVAIDHFDRLLRVEPQVLARIYPMLEAVAMTPQAQDAFAERLEAGPPWRRSLLRQLSGGAPDAAAIAPLFTRLARSGDGLDDDELRGWLDRLAREGEWGPAYLTWVGTLPAERKLAIGNVFDGGFEGEPSGLGFDWRFGRVAGARIDRVAGEGKGARGAVLRVRFAHQRVQFRHVRQLLALPSGSYRVSGRVRLESLSTERGLVWTVNCVQGGRKIGESAAFTGDHPDWRPFEFRVDVPAEKCGGQWLTLRLPARIAAEQRIGGSAWFDDLAAKRESVEISAARAAGPVPRGLRGKVLPSSKGRE